MHLFVTPVVVIMLCFSVSIPVPNNGKESDNMLLMIDNYDSFTYNLVQYINELGVDVIVKHNDEIDVEGILELKPRSIIISPGPGKPSDAGVSERVIRRFAGVLPILGVCLGHQAIGEVFGGRVVHASEVVHGKTSSIYHTSKGVFTGLQSPFQATRYHSLVLEKKSLPETLEVTAWTQHDDGSMDEIMGLCHRQYMIEGVQFHPESICSEFGYEILGNFLNAKANN
jgi:anthranilate synthase component 2